MSILKNFIDSIKKSKPHVGSNYLFDWPGVLPVEASKDSVIIQSVTIDKVDHTTLNLSVDGYSIPVLSTPAIPTNISITLLLNKNVVNGIYGKLLNMIYLDEKNIATGGLNANNYSRREGNIDNIAKIYLLNTEYNDGLPINILDLVTKLPYISIHYPRIKTVGALSFDSAAMDFTKCTIDLACAWITHERPGNIDMAVDISNITGSTPINTTMYG